MPRLPTDYSKTVIYKLVHKDDTDNKNVYVGSTTDFRKRKNAHKTVCNNPNSSCYNDPKYQFIRDNGGWNEWIMIEIEKYPCNDKREAEARERYWIEHYKSSLNKQIPTRSNKEWCEDNKEHIKQRQKEYRNDNKEAIKQKKKEWYEVNKEQVSKLKIQYNKRYYTENKDHIHQKNKDYREKNTETIKQINKEYRENNKEYIKQLKKEYREKNKETIKQKKKEYYQNTKMNKVLPLLYNF